MAELTAEFVGPRLTAGNVSQYGFLSRWGQSSPTSWSIAGDDIKFCKVYFQEDGELKARGNMFFIALAAELLGLVETGAYYKIHGQYGTIQVYSLQGGVESVSANC